MSTAIAVAASNQLAARAGLRLAEAGGNAVDSALAAVAVAMVCEPGICSPAGGAFITVASAGGSTPVTIDGNVEMPGRGLSPEARRRGLREVTTDYGGNLVMTVGHGSVATPGALAALDLAHRRYGRAPWRDVLAPAVEAARDGFPLGAASAYYLPYVHESVYGWHPDSYAALHGPDGRLLGAGATVHVPHLADSMQLIADQGADAFYRGDLAALIAADMAAHEGLLTATDLAAYEPVERPALPVRCGAWQLWTNPPPAIGGPVLAAMLTLMRDRPAGDWQPEDIAELAAVQDCVLGYRIEHLDVTDDRLAAGLRLLELVGADGVAALGGPASTIHVSAVDGDGTACAVTSSTGYGSGVMTPGTGLWLNNCLGEPELNRAGVHVLPPGERLPSNMAPTVGHTADGGVLAIGSPGADRITSALLQVLLSFANGGLDLGAAIGRPRLHVRRLGRDSVVEYEDDLELPPLPLPARSHGPASMYFGGVGAALRDPDGTLCAEADPRRAGYAAVGPATA
ncbi:MAG TPA: gamma-glutamyltransferase [Cryptosporangiaceae bacterium]|nr:gamma-glutamyltransferase [Cryptosporangiaceae bacterium]